MGENGDSGGPHVKYVVGKTAFQNGLVAGFVAMVVATLAGLWFYGVKLPIFNFPNLNAYTIFGLGYGFANPLPTFVVGAIIHGIDAILFALVFVLLIYPMMGRVIKPLAAMTPVNNLIKGLIFGWALWVISSAFWMPLLIGPLFGVGPFLTSFGPYGVQALFTNLLWHTIYGANLGLLYSPSWVSSGKSTSAGSGATSGG